MAWIEETCCSSVTDFLIELDPANKKWDVSKYELGCYKTSPNGWVYRGQRESSWTLTPSICRGKTHLNAKERGDVFHDEFQTVVRFNQTADRLGLTTGLQTRDQRAIDTILNSPSHEMFWDFKKSSPMRYLVNAIALAQHHGIPTRFLDWSVDPYSASFFAVFDWYKYRTQTQQTSSGHLAIWAIRHFERPNVHNVLIPDLPCHETRLEFIAPVFHESSYMRTQKGLFTVDPFMFDFAMKHGRWRLHDDALKETLSKQIAQSIRQEEIDQWLLETEPYVRKIKLRKSLKNLVELMTALKMKGYTYSSIYPWLDSIKTDFEMQRWAFDSKQSD